MKLTYFLFRFLVGLKTHQLIFKIDQKTSLWIREISEMLIIEMQNWDNLESKVSFNFKNSKCELLRIINNIERLLNLALFLIILLKKGSFCFVLFCFVFCFFGGLVELVLNSLRSLLWISFFFYKSFIKNIYFSEIRLDF